MIGETIRNWHRDRAPRMGAALAYYITLSLAPTVVIVLAIAGLAFGAKAAQGRLVWQIQGLVGHEGAKVIQSLIDGTHAPYSGIACDSDWARDFVLRGNSRRHRTAGCAEHDLANSRTTYTPAMRETSST